MLLVFVNILMVRKMIKMGMFNCEESEFSKILVFISIVLIKKRLLIVMVFNVGDFLMWKSGWVEILYIDLEWVMGRYDLI